MFHLKICKICVSIKDYGEMMFKKLANLFGAGNAPTRNLRLISVRCIRCGEIITARLDISNDLSETDDGGFIARKTVMGSGENRCFQRVNVAYYFNAKRVRTNREISGGTFVD